MLHYFRLLLSKMKDYVNRMSVGSRSMQEILLKPKAKNVKNPANENPVVGN